MSKEMKETWNVLVPVGLDGRSCKKLVIDEMVYEMNHI